MFWAIFVLTPIGFAQTSVLPVPNESAIKLDASSSTLNHSAGTLEFRDIVISQESLSLSANSASTTSLEFSNNLWRLRGNVKIESAQVTLIADHADIRFVKNELTNLDLQGSPLIIEGKGVGQVDLKAREGQVHFNDRAPSRAELRGDPVLMTFTQTEREQAVIGGADQINFDFLSSVIALEGKAKLQDDKNEVSGNRISYNLNQRKILAQSDPDTGEPVHIIIHPNTFKQKPIDMPVNAAHKNLSDIENEQR
ncbi:MAG: hypothetical protein HKM24_08185 [Gammaproteobacteria bacterium]|nr:hypothetical protein [Gammaproteobacteria bacterium]